VSSHPSGCCHALLLCSAAELQQDVRCGHSGGAQEWLPATCAAGTALLVLLLLLLLSPES
jgi:hypothetical protein